jgi:hypothetical protein
MCGDAGIIGRYRVQPPRAGANERRHGPPRPDARNRILQPGLPAEQDRFPPRHIGLPGVRRQRSVIGSTNGWLILLLNSIPSAGRIKAADQHDERAFTKTVAVRQLRQHDRERDGRRREQEPRANARVTASTPRKAIITTPAGRALREGS